MIYEFIGPSGSGKTYSTRNLQTVLDQILEEKVIISREALNIDHVTTFYRWTIRIQYILTVFLNISLMCKSVQLLLKWCNILRISIFKLGPSILFNYFTVLALIHFYSKDKNKILILDQGMYQLISSIVIRSKKPECIDRMIDALHESIPYHTALIFMNVDINVAKKNLSKRNLSRDDYIYNTYYSTDEKIEQTKYIFQNMQQSLNSVSTHGLIICDGSLESIRGIAKKIKI